MKCPICKKDISNTFRISESEVPGHLSYSYECERCKITTYVWKVETSSDEQ